MMEYGNTELVRFLQDIKEKTFYCVLSLFRPAATNIRKIFIITF